MSSSDQEKLWAAELREAQEHATRCQAHCSLQAHELIAHALIRYQSTQGGTPSIPQIEFLARAFHILTSSIAFADLMGIALPRARSRALAVARELCDSELPRDARSSIRFLVRANSLQGRMLEIQREESFRTDHPAPQQMQIMAPDGW